MTKLGDERDLRWNRVRAGMSERGIDCLIIIGNAGLISTGWPICSI